MLGCRTCSVLRRSLATPPKWSSPSSTATAISPSFVAISPAQLSQASAFHTTANQDKQKQGKIQKVQRVRVGYVNVRKTARVKYTRPAEGERRAKKNNIVLASGSALQATRPLLTSLHAVNPDTVGSMFFLPVDEMIDQLRALKAFQRNQMWQYFPRPCTLIRPESVILGRWLHALGGQVPVDVEGYPTVPDVSLLKPNEPLQKTYVLDGVGGSGKSVLIAQVMCWALMKKWVIINVPNAHHLSIGTTEYQPVEGTDIYQQPVYLQEMMSRILEANKKVLGTHILKSTHQLSKKTFEEGRETLKDLVEYGASVENALETWPVLLKDLEQPGSPPVLFALDNMDYITKLSAYRSPDFKLIHSFDLDIVKTFLEYFSGKKKFHRGLILASTTSQVHPFPSFDLTLKKKPLPPLGDYDRRIPIELGNDFEVLRVKGVDRQGARAILEYCREAGIWDDSWETSMPLPGAFDKREGKRERDENVLKEKRTEALMEWYNKKAAMKEAEIKAELPSGHNPNSPKTRILDRVVAEKHVLSGGLPGELIKTCLRMT